MEGGNVPPADVPQAGGAPRGAKTWPLMAGAFVMGAIAAAAWGPLGAPFFDGTARSLLLLDMLMLLAVAAIIALVLRLTGLWSLGRLVGGILASGVGFGAYFAVVFMMLISGGGCDVAYHEATWQDRELFFALDAPVQPPAGVPVGNGTYALSSLSVSSVRWLPEGNGTLLARFRSGENESGVEWQARQLLEVATDLDAQAIEDRIKEFLATRLDAHHPGRGIREVVYSMPQQIRVEPFLADDGRYTAGWTVKGVQVRFMPATKAIDLDGYALQVDAFGNARMQHDWGTVERPDVLADVRHVLIGHDLPAPHQVDARHSVCPSR